MDSGTPVYTLGRPGVIKIKERKKEKQNGKKNYNWMMVVVC